MKKYINKIRLSFTIFTSKLLIILLRILKRGGTTLPGKVAFKLFPELVNIITKDFTLIMVTGTNGKTTTSRIIGQILTENSIEYISNKSGANLVSGIITTFIESVNFLGKSSISTALIEIDEAAFKAISQYIHPNILVVTNFFRDQLDRYGELYTTLKGIQQGIDKSSNIKLVLNSDDSLCASLGKNSSNKSIYFGFDNEAYEGAEENTNSDAMFCIYCKSKYEYSSHVYGHLGGFACPSCNYHRPKTEITCTKVVKLSSSYSDITFSIDKPECDNNELTARINLPGLYNIYNALAAISCGTLLDLPIENTITALNKFECGFGRMESISTQGKNLKIILVKNPTGFNQVLNYLLTEEKNMQVAFLINDNLADGTDISWLWDVDFETLCRIQDNIINVYTSGTRGEDMAVRLKYAGIFGNKISIVKDYTELIDTALLNAEHGQNIYFLPTYTAMMDIRKDLKNKFKLKEFWK